MKKLILFSIMSIFLLTLVSAADFTPQGDINLRGIYEIKNATNITAEYYCNDTDCYTLANLKNDSDTTYSAGSNMSLVGTIFSINMTSVQNFFDTIYQAIGNYLTTATNFGGEVSGNASNIVLDDDALDDQYVNLEGDAMTGDLNMSWNNMYDVDNYTGRMINVTCCVYLGTIQATDGNSIKVQPDGDVDDFFSFKTPADRPTIKRHGGKFIYFESTNVYDMGISFRDDDTYSGTVNYEKDNHVMTLLGKNSPVGIKTNSEYYNYFLFETYNHQPQISVYNGTILKINDSLQVIGDGNFTGNVSAVYFCNSTDCYLLEQFLSDSDTTYTAGSNLSLTGTEFAVNTTSLKDWLDTIYQAIGNYLTTATNFGGEVSGNASNIILDNDALDDQYVELTDLPLANQTLPHCDNITGSDFNLCVNPDTTIGNCSGDGSCSAITYDSELTYTVDTSAYVNCSSDEVFLGNGSCRSSDAFYDDTTIGNCSGDQSCANVLYETDYPMANKTTPYCGNITGATSNLCTLTDTDTTYTNGSAISLVGTQFNLTTCADNEIWKMNGAVWNCEADDAGAGAYEFNITGDTGTQQTIDTTNVVSILGGTNGIDTVVGATDKITINIDISEMDTATPSDGDTTHLSTADHIYDWVISLAYATVTYVESLGNWSADKSYYWNTSTDLDTVIDADEIAEGKIAFSTACAAGNHYYLNGNDLACEADDDTTYTAGNGIALAAGAFSVAGNTALTQDADGLSVTADGVGDTQLAFNTGQHLTTTSDVVFSQLNVSDHFRINTANITCFNSGCTWYTNATDSCMYWPSGGKDCGAA